MSIIKCKMCGGDLILEEGSNVAECEYCGSRQTVPSADNEKKLNLFARANRLRANNEFDKASGVYESIVADFPEEAEAYWGLILCKYGIEYVDDPATGKKIPTCHRSSFDSVMDDPNFELVMEYSDPIARRVYREEAKQLEELRKGIIEVSSKEEPYDIFICYKETAEDGQRTLDSVLAQDVYDMLTENGYRVFFSRVTLEDKLGVEYEPYIFAALNSAKIMLAFGTDYDYYNAVWVKNEWSRFLQLIAKGEKKTLIPCYKNIDAYDMPKEFAKLQAQDLGKVGANQDLLRGIMKILPKEQPKASAPQQVIVQQQAAAGPTVDNLLRRGNIFLEEKNWGAANEYFDKALDIDAECARAYIGKFLVENQLFSLNELSNQWNLKEEPALKTVPVEIPNEYRIFEIIETYCLNPYLSDVDINNRLPKKPTYESGEEYAQEHLKNIHYRFDTNRNLSLAKRFADNALSKEIEDAVDQCIGVAERLLKRQIEEAAQSKQSAIDRYEAELAKSEEEIAKRYEIMLQQREQDYVKAVEKSETSDGIDLAVILLKKVGNYKNGPQLLKQCQERAVELKKAAAQEKKRKEEERKRTEAEERAKRERREAAENAFRKNASLSFEKRIAANANHTVGLKADGTVLAAGENTSGECALDSWKDVVEVTAGFSHSVGLKADGTVLISGVITGYSWSMESVKTWRNIVAIAAGSHYTIGLKQDGSVVAAGENSEGECNVSTWRNIIAISAERNHTVGLCANGTVIATGNNNFGQCDVERWKNIIAVAAGDSHTVGLRSDGTVVAVGFNPEGTCAVSKWKNIVAIAAGFYHTVGLCADGRVVTTTSSHSGQANKHGECNVYGWRDIIAIQAGWTHTVGLKSDGTLVATGENKEGQCDVKNWRLFDGISGIKKNLQQSLDLQNRRKLELQNELANTKGIFNGKRRRELESEIAELNTKIADLQKQFEVVKDYPD